MDKDNKGVLKEFKSADGQSTAADPATTGDASRGADKSSGESSYSFTTKSELLSAIMSNCGTMSIDKLHDVFKGLGPTGSTSRGADKSAGESGQVSTSSTSVTPGHSGDVHPTMTGSTGPGERGQIRTSSTAVKEDIEEMFGGDDLSEELKEKATVVFEAAVNARLVMESTRLEEEYNTRLDEALEEIRTEMVDKVDTYLSYVVEEWLEDNKVAVDTGLKTEMAEGLILGLKDLFIENYIEVPDEQVDVVAEMAEKIEELESRLNEEIEKNVNLKESNETLELNDIFEEASKGLTLTESEKFETLAEGVSFDSPEEFANKLRIIRETYFKKTATTTSSPNTLTEEVEIEEVKPAVTGNMSQYITAISKDAKR